MLARLRVKINDLNYKTKEMVLSVLIIVMLFIGLILLSLTLSSEAENRKYSEYEMFIKNYTKKYTPQEQVYRRFVFYQTHDDIFNNKQLDRSYYQGVNSFTDLQQQQFKQLYFIVTSVAKQKEYLEIAEFEKKYYYNWIEYMPPVKDMKSFDGNHIFAVVSLMEFQINRKYYNSQKEQGRPISLEKRQWITLSEQQIIDCCQKCTKQTLPKNVYFHLENYGISIDAKYPFSSSIFQPEPKPCQTLQDKKPFKIKGFYEIKSCSQMRQKLQSGPVVVGVDARTWRHYEGGIHDKCSAGSKINHYALLVGKGINYWIIRNSWGTKWGQRGHIRIKSDNHCGVCMRGSYLALEQ